LPVAGYDAARDVPGAHMLPNPATEYKVVFDIAVGADAIDDVNPRLEGLAEYVNTLAKYGVPAEKRKIAVVFHRGSTEIILKDAAFKARNDGHSNPNIALIQSLAAAGVKFHVCGQAVLARKIDPQDILPEIQLDLWALTTLIDLGLQGYVRIGG
jgi:intracellular sulfur oxidation DsrE/DsrF family protein